MQVPFAKNGKKIKKNPDTFGVQIVGTWTSLNVKISRQKMKVIGQVLKI